MKRLSTVNKVSVKDEDLEGVIEMEFKNYGTATKLLQDTMNQFQRYLNQHIHVNPGTLDARKHLRQSKVPDYMESIQVHLDEIFETEEAISDYQKRLGDYLYKQGPHIK